MFVGSGLGPVELTVGVFSWGVVLQPLTRISSSRAVNAATNLNLLLMRDYRRSLSAEGRSLIDLDSTLGNGDRSYIKMSMSASRSLRICSAIHLLPDGTIQVLRLEFVQGVAGCAKVLGEGLG